MKKSDIDPNGNHLAVLKTLLINLNVDAAGKFWAKENVKLINCEREASLLAARLHMNITFDFKGLHVEVSSIKLLPRS